MSKGYIHIKEIDVLDEEERATLVACVDDNGNCKSIRYTVARKYIEYLTNERSDAFVVALLYYAMINNYDIAWDIPCDEKLIYQLETYFIPVYASEILFMYKINLSGPVLNETLEQYGGVATGISNGVDSCYTIKKYIGYPTPQFRLTHLIFTNWFLTDFSDENQLDFMSIYLEKLPKQVEELGLEFLFVDFNLDKNFSIGHFVDKERGDIQDVGFYTLKYCSIALALQKLISIYYFSGGYSPAEFSFKKDDMSYHDLFTLPLISSSVQFYSTGMEVSRLDKVKYIADWEYAKNNLQVCMLDNDCNCGRCGKCIRTMGELYACGKLDDFYKRFPVENFKKNLSARLAKILVQSTKKHVFEQEIIAEIKGKDIKVPLQAYLKFPFYYIFEQIRLLMRKNKMARKIYRALKLDLKIYGKRTYSKYLDDENN